MSSRDVLLWISQKNICKSHPIPNFVICCYQKEGGGELLLFSLKCKQLSISIIYPANNQNCLRWDNSWSTKFPKEPMLDHWMYGSGTVSSQSTHRGHTSEDHFLVRTGWTIKSGIPGNHVQFLDRKFSGVGKPTDFHSSQIFYEASSILPTDNIFHILVTLKLNRLLHSTYKGLQTSYFLSVVFNGWTQGGHHKSVTGIVSRMLH